MVRGQAEELGIAGGLAKFLEIRRQHADAAAPHGCEATEVAGPHGTLFADQAAGEI
jgi:hypothetical protein